MRHRTRAAVSLASLSALLAACGASVSAAADSSPASSDAPAAKIKAVSGWTKLPAADTSYDHAAVVRLVRINGACVLESYSSAEASTNFSELPDAACSS